MKDRLDELNKEEQVHLHVEAEDERTPEPQPLHTVQNASTTDQSNSQTAATPTSCSDEKSECSSISTPLARGKIDRSLARRVPLKRSTFRLSPVSLLFLIPLTAALMSLLLDPTAPYLLKMNMHLNKWDNYTIEQLTGAINIRKDPELLERRASLYGMMHKFDQQENDLQELEKLGFSQSYSPYDRAQLRACRGLFDETTKQLLKKQIAMALNPTDKKSEIYAESNLESSILALTLCGDFHAASSVNSPKYQDHLSQSIVARELGEDDKASLLLKKCTIDGPRWSPFPKCIEALMYLDKHDPAGAEAIIKDKDGALKDDLEETIKAWTAFEKGDQEKALKISKAIIKEEEYGYYSFIDINSLSSLHYLMAHIYEVQGKKKLAAEEIGLYKKFGNPGKVFIPKPYRDWYQLTPNDSKNVLQ